MAVSTTTNSLVLQEAQATSTETVEEGEAATTLDPSCPGHPILTWEIRRVECTVTKEVTADSRDPLFILSQKPTTKLKCANTSRKASAPTKASVASLTAKANSGRSSPCSNNRKNSIKTITANPCEVTTTTKSMVNNLYKSLFHLTITLHNKICSTTLSSSNSGSSLIT